MTRDVSVIIPFHRGSSYLISCLQALDQNQIPRSSVLIAQNAPLGDPAPPKALLGDAHLLNFGEPVGYATAINEGVNKSASEYLCFCDVDAFPLPSCIDAMLDVLENRDDVHFVSPVLLSSTTDRIIDCGIGMTDFGHFHPWLDRSLDEMRAYQDDDVELWPAVCSAIMVCRRKDFLYLGGFDISYVDYYQDVDLCLRAKRRGLHSGIAMNALGYHMGRSSGVHAIPKRHDMVAHHLKRHGAEWSSMVSQVMRRQIDTLARSQVLPDDAFWADLSTLAENDEYRNVVAKSIRLMKLAAKQPSLRDATHLNLFNHLDHEGLISSLPVIYFVDRFISLMENSYWLASRKGSGDLVIDRHCNVLPVDQLCKPHPCSHKEGFGA